MTIRARLSGWRRRLRAAALADTAGLERRAFTRGLASVGGVMLGLVLLPVSWARAAEEGSPATDEEPTAPREKDVPRRWGMAIDLDLCTACGACSVACKTENNVPLAGPDPGMYGANVEWMSMLPGAEGDEGFGIGSYTLPLPCMHCADPPCTKVCPVGATYQTDEGTTAQIWDRCIGCRYCQVACPYSRRSFNWAEPEWPESYRSLLNPDVATRPRGVVEKCTFCAHRVREVREEARVAGEIVADEAFRKLPACAEACPADAIVFGDMLDEESRVLQLARSPRAFRLLELQGTDPKVFYLGKDRREDPR